MLLSAGPIKRSTLSKGPLVWCGTSEQAMLIAVVAVALLGCVLGELPVPILVSSARLHIAVNGMVGVEYRYIQYTNKGQLYYGNFKQTGDGQWHHFNPDVQLEEDELRYRLVAETEAGVQERTGVLRPMGAAGALAMPVKRAGHTVLRDDFDSFNSGNWDHEVSMYGGYNWEIQVYTNDKLNVYTKNGHLFLRPTLTSDKFGENYLHTGTMDVAQLWGHCTNADRYGCVRHGRDGLLPPVMSGKITSKATLRFGRVEVRARTPCGDWLWPALWMLPKSSHYGAWPRSGEIDLMESRGNSVASSGGVNHGNHEVSSTLHWGIDAGHNRYSMTHGERRGTPFCTGFHTYVLDWTIDHIVTSVDGHVILNVPTPAGGFWQKGNFPGSNIWASGTKAAPFDQPFYFIMNVAVAGTNGFFPDNWQYNSPKPWNNNSPTEGADFWNHRHDWLPSWHGESVAMEVDYIQMTQY